MHGEVLHACRVQRGGDRGHPVDHWRTAGRVGPVEVVVGPPEETGLQARHHLGGNGGVGHGREAVARPIACLDGVAMRAQRHDLFPHRRPRNAQVRRHRLAGERAVVPAQQGEHAISGCGSGGGDAGKSRVHKSSVAESRAGSMRKRSPPVLGQEVALAARFGLADEDLEITVEEVGDARRPGQPRHPRRLPARFGADEPGAYFTRGR